MNTPEQKRDELHEQQIERARATGQHALETEPRAAAVTVDTERRILSIVLEDGTTLTLSIDKLQELQGAPPEQLKNVTMTPQGFGLHWEALDADLHVPALARGVYGTRRWMAQLAEQGSQGDI